ncbi:UNVERIFIED_ORG: hypothetical protein M2328_005771 [Rhodococcus erythropolis]
MSDGIVTEVPAETINSLIEEWQDVLDLLEARGD